MALPQQMEQFGYQSERCRMWSDARQALLQLGTGRVSSERTHFQI